MSFRAWMHLGKVLGKGLGKVRRARLRVMPTSSTPARTLASLPARGVPVHLGLDRPRPLHEHPQQHTRGLVGALNAEWRRLAAGPAGRPAAWATAEPILAAFADLAAVVD